MTVMLGFFSFSLRKNAPKLMTAPKGPTKWKAKFFYVKAATVTARLHYRNVTDNIATEQLSTPAAGEQFWLQHLRLIPLKKLGSRELQLLGMMLRGKPGQKTRLVLKEKNEGKCMCWLHYGECSALISIAFVECGADEEGWYETIVGNFRVADAAALSALLPKGKGSLGALGDPDATGVPSAPSVVLIDKQKRKKKTHDPITIPDLVPGASGTFRPRFPKSEDYVLVFDTLEGLGVLGSSSRAGGATASAKPRAGLKRKEDTAAAGGEKPPKLRNTRAAVLPKHKPAGSVGKLLYVLEICARTLPDRYFLFCRNCKGILTEVLKAKMVRVYSQIVFNK
ncbi:hypothetical protein HanPI659440_Chr03g0125371 [Helianthus annuus]|nr:hypothetical protein HanPI659440_Chr03g0125371 [Helianthus annuus]